MCVSNKQVYFQISQKVFLVVYIFYIAILPYKLVLFSVTFNNKSSQPHGANPPLIQHQWRYGCKVWPKTCFQTS